MNPSGLERGRFDAKEAPAGSYGRHFAPSHPARPHARHRRRIDRALATKVRRTAAPAQRYGHCILRAHTRRSPSANVARVPLRAAVLVRVGQHGDPRTLEGEAFGPRLSPPAARTAELDITQRTLESPLLRRPALLSTRRHSGLAAYD